MTLARASESSPLAPESLIIRPASFFQFLHLGEIFAKSQPLEVELGSGEGGFITQYARQNPERNFLGVERLLGRLRKIDRKGRRAGLKNLRVLRIEALYFLEFLLPAQSAAALHVYFPDPWPKRKHRPRRLINARFTELAERVLLPGGTVFLRTDDADYFQQMLRVFGANANFRPVETPASLQAVRTNFEVTFHAQGIATNTAAFQLRSFP